MNREKVQQIITETIETFRAKLHPRQVNRQYPVAKWQITKLEELGILDLMPKNFGHGDAGAVIEAATQESSAIMNAFGEGEEVAASALNDAISEAEENQFVGMTTIGANTGKIFLAEGATESEARNNSLDAIILDWCYATIYDDTKRKNLEIVTIAKARQYGYKQSWY